MSKAREWWIWEDPEGHDDYVEATTPGGCAALDNAVHVIEYAAYEKAVAALRQIERMDFELAGAIKISSDTLKELGELD